MGVVREPMKGDGRTCRIMLFGGELETRDLHGGF